MRETDPTPLTGEDELDGALAAPIAVLYKHSPLCGRSLRAQVEIERFMADHPGVPVYQIDVIRSRPLSREVERRLGIRHESPQALLLRAGAVLWHGSHGAVTAATLERALD